MKTPPCFIKSILPVILLLVSYFAASAQKADNIQKAPMLAPAAIKIDGKLGEWGPALQAYNKTTKVWYTIANNDKNLYLAIKCTDNPNINKILAGGISLMLNTAGKKKDKDAFILTYPVVNRAAMRSMRGGKRGAFGFGQQQDAPDTAAILALHRQALAASKVISAIGFKEITDTLVSIYNEYGIKAVARFEDNGTFAYELAVPLQMLHISVESPTEIAYNIQINGFQMDMNGGFGGRGGGRNGGWGGGGGTFSIGLDGGGGGRGFGGADMNDMISPTDFWGKYTLIKSTPTAK